MRVAIAHPSPDLYGSDRQLLESVSALTGRGDDVTVLLPRGGPLAALLDERGANVRTADFPVLRKALLRPTRLPGLLWANATATVRAARWLRRERPDALYVNTVTIPLWQLAGRLARVPVLVHVHEAEDGGRVVATALMLPLLLARAVVTNSQAAADVVVGAVPRLSSRTRVVYNGVPGPPAEPSDEQHGAAAPWRLAVVGRLSPRKGSDIALEAVALLAAHGRDVRLTVAGTVFDGYEWYEDQLRSRAAEPDLAGRVTFAGYVHPTWELLADSDVVLVPSRVEPFGNTAVEAMLARRALVASRTQGLVEVVRDGETGVLVEPDDARALADAIARLLDDDALRARLARQGEADAHARFSVGRYAEKIAAAVDAAAGPQ